MSVTVQHFEPKKVNTDVIVYFVAKNKAAFEAGKKEVVKFSRSASHIFDSKDFKGEAGSSALHYTGKEKAARLLVVGIGSESDVNAESLRKAGAAAAAKCGVDLDKRRAAYVLPEIKEMDPAWVAKHLAEGALLANYRYDKWITVRDRKQKNVSKVSILVADKDRVTDVRAGAKEGQHLAEATLLARDLANAPSNELYPGALADRAKELKELGVNVKVLDKKKITELGMGGLLAVNQGSTTPPFFVIMEWNGGEKDEAPIVLVGKGITFDSGGISLKPGPGMGDMKMDMGGAAAVIGAMHGVASLKLAKNVVGLVPTTDNMPSGSSYKPGDVITFLNGKTAEIDNTDAEGRLILADGLSYAERYNPAAVVDLATLTGACMIALGHYSAGLMGTDDGVKSAIKTAADHTYERVTELPLWSEYEQQLQSDVADVKNVGGRPAGAITAGLFLKNFVGDYPWAHLDIAGVGINPKPYGYVPKGGTGFGARLMVEFIRGYDSDAAQATAG
jgi:leucyl aminopeptidase